MVADRNQSLSARRSLRPPQFGLRTLLAIVTACSILLAVRQWLDPIAIFAIAFCAVSIFCHIAGNAIGTRLRQIGDVPEGAPRDEPIWPARVSPKPQDFAPATRLSQRQSLGWTIIIASSIGATSGAIGGGFWTFLSAHGPVEPVNIFVGVIAFAVLGGLAAFAVFGFTQVLFGAVWQALHPPANVQRTESPSQ